MTQLFVDTSFLIALVNRRDSLYPRARELAEEFDEARWITTDSVLLELGNALASRFRRQAVQIIEAIQQSREINLLHLTPELFRGAFDLYKARPDKSWGFVDCISFVVMGRLDLVMALTADRHFQQAGFTALMLEE